MRMFGITIMQEGKCAYCHQTFNTDERTMEHGHLLDYELECKTDKTIKVPNPTKGFPAKYMLVPDCETYYLEDADHFKECAIRIDFMHPFCHRLVHGLVHGADMPPHWPPTNYEPKGVKSSEP